MAIPSVMIASLQQKVAQNLDGALREVDVASQVRKKHRHPVVGWSGADFVQDFGEV